MSNATAAAWLEAPADHVGDAIVAAAAAGGIDHLFFTSGSEIGFFQESIAKSRALGRERQIRLVTVPLEHVALNAALGYAAVSGRPAMTAAHVDCGTLHYGGAWHSAWRSGLPVVVVAGYPPTAYPGTAKGGREDGGHLWAQETYDQNGIVRNYTKWDHRLTYHDNAALIVSRAIQVACSEPCGPAYISVPKEVAMAPLQGTRFPAAQQLGIPRAAPPDPDAALEIAQRLVAARNPVIVVSGSGRDPRTVAPLVQLCELLGIAVVDAGLQAYLSFPFRHPLFQPQAALGEADAVLVLEAEVPWTPGRNGPPPGAYVAVVGQDSVKLRFPTYEFTADVRLTADALLTLRAITAAAQPLLAGEHRQRIVERSRRLAASSRARIEAADRDALARASASPIDPLWASYQVGKAIGGDCIVIDDTLAENRVRDYLPRERAGTYFGNPGSSGGWAPGAALGAKLAAPDHDVVALTGDGFYMFGTPAPALWAARHHGAPFMTVVYTNRSYTTGTSRVAYAYGKDSYAARAGFEGGYFDPPIDFAKEAEAAGGYGETVRDPAELGPALERGLEQTRNGRPAVISIWMKRLEADS